MSVTDAGDNSLMLLVQGDKIVYHGLVPFVDQRPFDCREFFPDFFDVGIEVLFVVLQLAFYLFLTDEEPSKSGEEKFEFLGDRHGFPHTDEENLCVGVDEGNRQLV